MAAQAPAHLQQELLWYQAAAADCQHKQLLIKSATLQWTTMWDVSPAESSFLCLLILLLLLSSKHAPLVHQKLLVLLEQQRQLHLHNTNAFKLETINGKSSSRGIGCSSKGTACCAAADSHWQSPVIHAGSVAALPLPAMAGC
jgi:hypothetical protein